jgi:pimeloyl-ACP methyl ester carboxylesterase
MATIIFIPGLNCDADLFRDQIAALRENHDIRIADTTRDETISGMAARLLEANPEEGLILVGLSMGGYAALEAIAQAPDRIAGIALLDTSARADSEEASANRRRLINLTQAGRFDEVCETLWLKLVAPERRDDDALRTRVNGMAATIGPQTFVQQQEAIMQRRDHRPLLSQIAVPALILVGDQDELTPPALSQEMGELVPDATLGIIPDCGHLSTMERPEAVNRALAAWLARV